MTTRSERTRRRHIVVALALLWTTGSLAADTAAPSTTATSAPSAGAQPQTAVPEDAVPSTPPQELGPASEPPPTAAPAPSERGASDAPLAAQPGSAGPSQEKVAVESPADVQIAPEPKRRKKAYSALVWMQPVGLAYGISRAGEEQTRGRPMVYIPIGANASVSRELDLAAEFTLNIGHDSCNIGNCRTFQGWWLTFGANWHPFQNAFAKGFFIQPKAIYSAFDEQTLLVDPKGPPLDFGGSSRLVHVGADIGYQYVLGYLYFAAVVGVSGGYCQNCADDRPGPMWGYATKRSDHFSLAYNLNLLRMGVAFY